MKRLGYLLLALFALASCERPPQLQQLSGFAQGTTWNVSIWRDADLDTQALQRRIDAELQRLDLALSNYRDDSVIERFNATQDTQPQPVGEEILRLVETARQVSEASQGCYDLTIKPLFELWGFSGAQLNLPDEAALQAVQQQIGFARLSLLPPDRLAKPDPQMRLDLSSIAQGYTVARIAALLEDAGVEHYIAEIGGELQTRGHKPDGSRWRIGVERPLPGGKKVHKALTIQQDAPLAVMTSGTYRHYYDANGKRYSHVLDARSGAPVQHHTLSVTVVHPDPTLADAWSTALLCLGQQAGEPVANHQHIAALFISDHNGQLQETTSLPWQNMTGVQVE